MSQNIVTQFADIRILRYEVPHFNELPLQKKIFIYYLYEAALSGRDMLFDQHFEYNLVIRTILERMADFNDIESLKTYLNRVWFSSGIHHHYSTLKFKPDFSKDEFNSWFVNCKWDDLFSPSLSARVLEIVSDIIFNENRANVRVSQNSEGDLVKDSCTNFYKNVNQAEAEEFYRSLKNSAGYEAPSFGLNARLLKKDGKLHEEVWYADGKYGAAIKNIIQNLTKAQAYAENEKQKKVIQLLIDFYTTGDLSIFDQYNIEWLNENSSSTDFINGFIEVYGDPLGMKGSWEALVNTTDIEETQRVKVISENAQWFEDHSPVDPQHRKEKVEGVSMKIINVVTLGGDCYPASPLGINLPNADWIREKHGSKSVSLANISAAHHKASLTSGVVNEFAATSKEIELHKRYGSEADHLHTHLHECLGHGSGRMISGVTSEMLKVYSSVIEETRADLFGLYFMMDEKIVDLNLVSHPDVAKAQYNSYIRNGLMVQLTRIALGAKIEQAHMRNRQLIASWAFEKGQTTNVIERVNNSGKTGFIIHDYLALRQLFGQLLKEVQRIKSEGDYEAARQLVETYGVQINYELHAEVLERFKKLNIAPFTGFINPILKPVTNKVGIIENIVLDETENYEIQMARYSKEYGYLVQDAFNEFINSIK
jgi:dipeptidyl-peptidase-3